MYCSHIPNNGATHYRVTWRDPQTNRRHQQTFTNRVDADEFSTKPRHNPSDTGTSEPQTLSRLCEQSIAGRPLTDSTVNRLRSICRTSIAAFFGDRHPGDITPEMVAAWVRWLTDERHYSPRTVRDHFRVLASTTRWASQIGILRADPCRWVALPRIPRPAGRAPEPSSRRRVGGGSSGSAMGHSRDHDPIARLRRALHDATPEDIQALLREFHD
ncbi:phage integrase SAM-like domain-containing protein [Micromonospora sp. NPDC050397]|uniref:phage integrase SAM-like domain-containing protein n=1 Tax=Micromonospora sp. NPDC050397 TaxID=3364279 RepID=UPI00384B399E